MAQSYFKQQQPAWGRSREFDITTRSVNRNGLTSGTAGELEDGDDEDEGLVNGRRKRKVTFLPSVGKLHSISFSFLHEAHSLYCTM